MRRLFIIRKDLHLSAGKLAAMIGHCAEAYWTNLIKNKLNFELKGSKDIIYATIALDKNIYDNYIYKNPYFLTLSLAVAYSPGGGFDSLEMCEKVYSVCYVEKQEFCTKWREQNRATFAQQRTDIFLAGRGLPGFVIAGSLLLTNLSAEQLLFFVARMVRICKCFVHIFGV